MSSTFAQPANNFLATLASAHAIADGVLALLWGTGVAPLPALASGRVYRLTAWSGYGTTSAVTLAIVEATAIGSFTLTGATLSGLSFVEGYSDRVLGAGTVLTCEETAKDYEDHSAAINANEVTIAANTAAIALRALDAAVVHGAGAETIAGAKTFAAHAAFGNAAAVDDLSASWSGANATAVNVQETYSGDLSAKHFCNGLSCYVSMAPSTDSFTESIALDVQWSTPAGNARNLGTQYGLFAECNHLGTGSVTTVEACYLQVDNVHGGSIGTAYGFDCEIFNDSTGSIGTVYGAYIYISNSAATPFGDCYGLYVDAVTGNVTHNYGIYVADQSGVTGTDTFAVYTAGPAPSVFGGAVTAASFHGSGPAVTALNASALASGTVGTARLGTGTADSTTFLRGDQTWQVVASGLTIGTTAVSGGTAGRVLFEAAGPVVSDSTNLTYTSGTLQVQADTAAHVPLVAKGAASQSADVFQAQDSTGASLVRVLPGSVGWISSPKAQLVMEQTGSGTTRLRLCSQFGAAGALFENTQLDLVDFGFVGSSGGQGNLRYERRTGQLIDPANTSGEFQVMMNPTGSAAMPIVMGLGSITIAAPGSNATSAMLGVGTLPIAGVRVAITPDGTAGKGVAIRATPQVSIIFVATASNVATLITSPAHRFTVGDTVTVAGLAATAYNGTFTITATTSLTFSYALTHANQSNTADVGTAAVLQVGDLQQNQTGAAAVVSGVDHNGYPFMAKGTGAPAPTSPNVGAFYLDNSTGATKLYVYTVDGWKSAALS